MVGATGWARVHKKPAAPPPGTGCANLDGMFLLLLLACPSAPPTDDTGEAVFPACRDDADCTDGSSCFAPGACNVGDYEDPVDECIPGSPCSDGSVCQWVPAECGVDTWYQCVDSCASRGCDEGWQCDVGTGLCSPWSCADGYTCPEHTSCDPGADEGDHGCVRDSCAVDADCGGGFCVGARCYDSLGSCDFARP